MDELRGRYPTQKIIHKEETEPRMTADMKDRNALKRTLQLSVHPFDTTWHEPSVSRIYMYTREISPNNVQSNVHKSVEIGNK